MSGGFYGADVAELRQLAERFTRAAEDLERSAGMLTHQVTTTTQWQGRDAEGFRGHWTGSHRPSITAVSTRLRAAATALARNAAEQDAASGAGGPGSVRQGGRITAPVRLAGSDGATPLGPFSLPLDLLERLQSIELPTGQPVWDMVELIARSLGKEPFEVVSELQHAGQLLDSIVEGDVSPTEISRVVADGLQHVRFKPVALAGVAIDVWTDVAVEYQKADFSADGLALVGNYITEDPLGAIEGALDGIAGYLPTAGNHVLSAFGIKFGK